MKPLLARLMMKREFLLILPLILPACALPPQKAQTDVQHTMVGALDDAAKTSQEAAEARAKLNQALLPQIQPGTATVDASAPPKPPVQRFDMLVNNAPARQVFMSIASGTPYSMILDPGLDGMISVSLKDVTVEDALSALRSQYGYDYRIEGKTIFVNSLEEQTRIFSINYLSLQRKGISNTNVSSSALTDHIGGGGSGSSAGASGSSSGSGSAGGGNLVSTNSSKVTTTVNTDFWEEVTASLKAIVADDDKARVVVSPQSGMIVVRARPAALQAADRYLRGSQLVADREVMLEAKILNVQLNSGFQSGVNWAAFNYGSNTRYSVGGAQAGVNLMATGQSVNGSKAIGSTTFGGTAGANLSNTGAAGMFGLVFQTANFATLLQFLETQGSVNVLSNPRIATINNQKAVLKVGTDAFFVTDIQTSSTTSVGGQVTPNTQITTQPFFSGIALDITPQIDENNVVTLHVHPSVSQVTTVTTDIVIGAQAYSLPLASSDISETDSIVRVKDGNIVAIGGLIKQTTQDSNEEIPVLGNLPLVGNLFKNKVQSVVKNELVILIKPTVIDANADWGSDLAATKERIEKIQHDQ